MNVVRLNSHLVDKYEAFLMKNDKTRLYQSNKYRILLKSFLKQEDYFFVLTNDDGDIMGVFPTFIFENGKYGNIINSLPFYGSNGGIIEFDNNLKVRNELLTAFKKFVGDAGCVATTIISSPFEESQVFYEDNLDYDFKDARIGQITTFKDGTDKENLIELFHYKTRNMVRKAIKSNIKFRINNGEEGFRFLIDIYKENMEQLGGVVKGDSFFECIKDTFTADKEYRIYLAYWNGKPIAALLLFYFNKTVEYFTPVVKREFRNMQPMSLLIFEAMKDSIDIGYKYWNWGGTWLSQTGVYRFKKRWASEDRPYYYHTKIYDKKILSLSKEKLLEEYPYFYVCPFDELNVKF